MVTQVNGRQISVQEASVSTVTIEVKSIQINNKQMTLSVFRQLIEEDAVDVRNGGMNGELWGTVNYHTPNECFARFGPGEHFHVVWQKGDQLRRCVVYFNRLSEEIVRSDLQYYDAVGVWERLMGLPQLFIAV